MKKPDITFTAVVLQNGAHGDFEVADCGHNHTTITAARTCGKGFINPHSIYGGNGKRVSVRVQGFCTSCGEYSRHLESAENDYICEDCWEELVNPS